jgi:hypothetical protein
MEAQGRQFHKVQRNHCEVTPISDVLPLWLCLSSHFSLLQGHQSHWITAHPDDLILTNLPCDDPFPQTISLSEKQVLGLP